MSHHAEPKSATKGKRLVGYSQFFPINEPAAVPETPPRRSTRHGPPADEDSDESTAVSKHDASTRKWDEEALLAEGLPKSGSKLTDAEVFRVVMSNLPNIKRKVFYEDDFVQKRFVKTSRQYRDPPALLVDGSKFRYAVVCNEYQLHGAEGVKANLDHKKGSRIEKSVTAPPIGGNRRVSGFGKGGVSKVAGTKGAIKVEIPLIKPASGPGKTTARQLMEKEDLSVDDDDDGEELPPDGPPADPRYEGLRQYGKTIDSLYGDSLRFTKEVSDATIKSGYKPNVAAKRYNEGKKGWRWARVAAGEAVEEELDRD